MSTPREAVSLRAATADDDDFLLELYQSSRGDDLRGLDWSESRISQFLKIQYEAQCALDESEHAQATNEVILHAGEAVGRLLVEVNRDEIRCVDLALLPAHRNQGLGAVIVRRLQQQASVS